MLKTGILLILALALAFLGCGMPGDPQPDDLYTRNVYPGFPDAYSIGSDTLPYEDGWFNELHTGTISYRNDIWENLRIPANALKLHAVKPPLDFSYKGGAVLEFEDKAAPLEEIAYFNLQLPHAYKEGTDVCIHIHWTPETNGAGTVIWQFTYSWGNEFGGFPAPITRQVTATIDGQIDQHLHSEICPISGVGKEFCSVMICSIKRLSDTDTFTDSALLIIIDLHYLVGGPGSLEVHSN